MCSGILVRNRCNIQKSSEIGLAFESMWLDPRLNEVDRNSSCVNLTAGWLPAYKIMWPCGMISVVAVTLLEVI